MINVPENLSMGVFGSLIMTLLLHFRNSKWRIKYSGQNFLKLLKFHENWDIRVFWVADYESAIGLSKFEMVDPIWRAKIFKIIQIS